MFLSTGYNTKKPARRTPSRFFFAGCLADARPRTHDFGYGKVAMSCMLPSAACLWHAQARAELFYYN